MNRVNISLILPLFIFAFAIFSGLIIYRASSFVQDKHFSLLAESFIQGKLYLSPINLPAGDFADYLGRQYLFFGPLPSLILAPFVFFTSKNFPQMTLSIFSLVITYFVIFLMCKKLKFNSSDSFWLSNFFVFGSVLYFIGLVNISAYIAQTVATLFFVLSLWEFIGKKRWFLIGLYVGAAGATRSSLYLISVFFIIEIVRKFRLEEIKRPLLFFLIPIIFSMSFYGAYNYKRFHNVFDTGYTKNVTELINNGANRKIGFFNIAHAPSKLYLMLIKAPEPVTRKNLEFVLKFPYLKADGLGMAIWFTSPLLVYLINAKKREYTVSAIVAILILSIPALVYSGPGSSQYGYRYSLDFFPLLFLILISAFGEKLPKGAKILIAFGVIFNCFYMLSIWNSYPLLTFWKFL